MKRFFTILLLFITAATLQAQIPAGYYNEAIGKHGYELKSALAHIIDDHIVVPFSTMEVNYPLTDCDPAQDSLLIDIYGCCRFEVTQTGSDCYADSCICYDKEHLFCQSWMGGSANSSSPSFSDYHHIFPADGGINRARGNMYFGEVDNPNKTYTCGTQYGPMSFVSSNGNDVPHNGSAFEPIDEYKGDIARALFYVATRYMFEDEGFATDKEMTLKSQLRPWAVEMLLIWNTLDPVSDKEIARNNAIYGIQHNRNPYIDHPELVSMIFGNDTTLDFSDTLVLVERPRVANFEVNDVSSITVTYDSEMVAASITNAHNYTFNHGLSVDSITLVAPNQVTLHLTFPLTIGIYYYCIVKNGQGQNGIFMSDTACTFVYGYSPYHTVFAGWTFDALANSTLENRTPISANYGSLTNGALLYYNGQNGSSDFTYGTELCNYGGTLVGDPRTQGATDGKAFSIQSSAANGKHIVLKFSTANYTDLLLTYARRVTSTGFKKIFYEWSLDGSNFHPIGDTITLGNNTNYGTFELQTIDLQDIEEIEQQASVFLRITIDGAYATSSFDNGNIRFDNFCIHGQKCVAENIILYETISQGEEYTQHGFNIHTSAAQPTGTLEYSLQVDVPNQCDTLYTLYLTIVSGIGDNEMPDFKIYPNPAREELNITGENLREVQLYNSLGQTVVEPIHWVSGSTVISVGSLPAGVYFAKVTDSIGRSAIQKVIINR